MTIQKARFRATVQLPEVINEFTRFEDLFKTTQASIVVDCSRVARLNSEGIRSWLRFFAKLGRGCTQVLFQDLSPAIVHCFEFCNLIDLQRFSIESMSLPYYCTDCVSEFVHTGPMQSLRPFLEGRAMPRCPGCSGQNIRLDDDAQVYLDLLKRVSLFKVTVPGFLQAS